MIHIDIKKLGKFDQHRPSHHRRPHGPEQQPAASAGSSSMSASTTPRARLQPDHEDANARRAPWPSSRPPSPTTQASASPSQRVMTDNGSCYRSRAFRRACQRPRPQAHPNQALHAHEPTARPSASSKQPCANGPMPGPIRHSDSAPHELALLDAPLQLASTSCQYRLPSRPSADSALTEDNLLRLHS